VSPEEFSAHFDRFTSTVFRLETLQTYADPGEADRVDAFLRGLPRPERSIRTSPWLARIARTTLAGRQWLRVRVVEEPLTGYTVYEMAGYVESQAAGEQIRVALRAASWPPRSLRRDFWLMDAGTPGAFALLMNYGPAGQFKGAELVADPQILEELEAERDVAVGWSVPLNEYLVAHGNALRVA
jgi:Family of unknown function (DUF6879)